MITMRLVIVRIL